MTDHPIPFRNPRNPRAHSFDIWDCGRADCGLHVISFDEKGAVILETVMSPEQTLKLIHAAQDILYRKVTSR